MPLPNSPRFPTIWTEEELLAHAERSLNAFVDRRLAESDTKYLEHVSKRQESVQALFKILRNVDPSNPDQATVEGILLDADLQAAFRYCAGPPVSKDDLDVIATRSRSRLSKTLFQTNPALAGETLRLVCRMADVSRFPWAKERRKARPHELKHAIRSTAVLHATQTMQTYRRQYGREVEAQLRRRLVAEGFRPAPAPARARVNAPSDYPKDHSFYGECTVYGRKTDLFIGLADGRVVAVEAKDSASILNSVKRVLNDTAAKARHWGVETGKQLIPVVLLSGVFGIKNLKAAQESGLYLVWVHDLDEFVAWLLAQ
jgi:hypothetical protein